MRARLLGAALVLARVVAGCAEADDVTLDRADGTTTTAPTSTATAPESSTTGSTAAPTVPTLSWESCGGGRECATLTVPLDHDDATGPSIDLHVSRLPATGERRGALVVNFGGPGGEAAETIEVLGVPDEITEHFDVVGMDPRGVGQSTPLGCGLEPATLYSVDPTIEDDADAEALIELSKDYAADCATDRGDILPFLGTRAVARDMDLLRAVMGDEQLNYLGYSYGTAIGQVYADLFPERVRAMVLDGVVDPAPSGIDVATEQARGFERALANWAAGCEERSTCSFEDPLAAVDQAIAAAELGVPAQGGRTLGPGEMSVAVSYPLYAEFLWPDLDQALAGVLDGDGTDMLGLAAGYLTFIDFSIYFAVSCLDSTWPAEPQAFLEAAKQAATVSPRFGESLVNDYIRCAVWPAAPQPLGAIEAPGTPPILVVSTTGDPATPYEAGVRVADRLANVVLLTHNGEGHTITFSGSDCVDEIVVGYVVDGAVPPDGGVC